MNYLNLKSLCLCLLFIISCAKNENIEEDFPIRSKTHPHFFNNSSITEWDLTALHWLDKARKKTRIEFCMIILDKLPENYELGIYAVEAFKKWQVGKNYNGKGVLYLFVEDIHSLKIEVSYDLEPIFTDAYCASFQKTMEYYFSGKYFGDVMDNMISNMMEKYLNKDKNKEFLSDHGISPLDPSDQFLSGGAGISNSKFYFDRDKKLKQIMNIDLEKIKKYNIAKTPKQAVQLFIQSLAEGINYPFIGILTEGSQNMRVEYFKSKTYLKNLAHKYKKSSPYKIFKNGDLAAARFSNQNVMPILLRKNHLDNWLVDFTKTWLYSLSNFDHKKNTTRFKNNSWMFAFPDESYRKNYRHKLPKLIPFPHSIKEIISDLEKKMKQEPNNASNYFKLADIYYFENLWIRSAIDLVEKGLELDPKKVSYRWLLISMCYRFPKPKGLEKHYKALLKLTPRDKYVYTSLAWHYRTFLRDEKSARKIEKMWKK